MCTVWGEHVILGATRLKTWEQKGNLLFLSPHPMKCNNKGGETIPLALWPICSQPPAVQDLPTWAGKRKSLKEAVFHMKHAQCPLVF